MVRGKGQYSANSCYLDVLLCREENEIEDLAVGVAAPRPDATCAIYGHGMVQAAGDVSDLKRIICAGER